MNNCITLSGAKNAASFENADAFLHSLTAIRPIKKPSPATPERRDIGGGEIVAWVLAVPGAIAALVELRRQLGTLSERKELRDRIEPTFSRIEGDPSLELDIAGQTINLGNATLDDVLDAIARAEVEITSKDGDQ